MRSRFLAPLSASLMLAAAASAQCFEPNFGTPLGIGDDVLFATQPMGINFPMGGAFATYDQIAVNTNGCCFLWNSTGGALTGTTPTGYGGTTAVMTTNLAGVAGGGPRIAPYWRDLNILAANNSQVWLNNTIPGKCVITWENAVHWNVVGDVPFTVQAQLVEATGEIWFFYSASAHNANIEPLAGVSEGGGIAVPAATDFATPTAGVSTSRIVYETWTAANTFDLAGQGVLLVPNGTGYDHVPLPCPIASNQNVGAGCHVYNVPSPTESFYELYPDAVAASAALQGNAMLLVRTGTGYSATWLPGAAAGLYVPPTGGATLLPVNDDGDDLVTLPSPMVTNSGLVSAVRVSHNGIITLASTANNPGDFSPTGPELAAATGEAFYSWSDFRDTNLTPVPSGRVKTEQVGGQFHITWENVDHWASPQVTAPCTQQFQIDLATGNVTYVWTLIDTNTTSTFGTSYLVGYTGPGASTDPGSINLATVLPATTTNNLISSGMSLSASPTPRINPSTLVTYTANGLPEFLPGSGIYVSTMFLSVVPLPGGFDLTGVLTTVPGCNAYIATLDVDMGGQLTLLPSASWSVNYDNVTFAPGNVIGAQAVALFNPAVALPNGEAGGFVLSNGVVSTTQVN
ncbi:MAG: hypothetical protein JNL08_04660 [Planctomycetes bacterium]|nr:hypothetical protein [Planctomycetota bacterium]